MQKKVFLGNRFCIFSHALYPGTAVNNVNLPRARFRDGPLFFWKGGGGGGMEDIEKKYVCRA